MVMGELLILIVMSIIQMITTRYAMMKNVINQIKNAISVIMTNCTDFEKLKNVLLYAVGKNPMN